MAIGGEIWIVFADMPSRGDPYRILPNHSIIGQGPLAKLTRQLHGGNLNLFVPFYGPEACTWISTAGKGTPLEQSGKSA